MIENIKDKPSFIKVSQYDVKIQNTHIYYHDDGVMVVQYIIDNQQKLQINYNQHIDDIVFAIYKNGLLGYIKNICKRLDIDL